MHIQRTELCALSKKFYQDYPNPPYAELQEKKARPYLCLVLEWGQDCLICIPYRSEVRHIYGYRFRDSVRCRSRSSGLDYSKCVIIKKCNEALYLDKGAVVDNDEYTETMKNLSEIISGCVSYVEDFIAHENGTRVLHEREYIRRYRYSTLPYFRKELGITNT